MLLYYNIPICINHTKRLYIFAININVFLHILSYINYNNLLYISIICILNGTNLIVDININ